MQECPDLLFDIKSLFALLYDRYWAGTTGSNLSFDMYDLYKFIYLSIYWTLEWAGTQWAEPKAFAKVVRPPLALIYSSTLCPLCP